MAPTPPASARAPFTGAAPDATGFSQIAAHCGSAVVNTSVSVSISGTPHVAANDGGSPTA
jgi:hypothetical protein